MTIDTRRGLYDRFLAFPNVTYSDFLDFPEDLRQQVVSRNKILQNDTYNRTMGHMKGDRWNARETYVLQMRKAPDGYLIVYGLRSNLSKILEIPINEAELQFAIDFYKRANNPTFNPKMWESVINDHHGFLPIEVDAVPDGTAILPGDPVMRVSGPGELAAHFESVFHRVFYDTLVATTAFEISRQIGPDRFLEVGRRSTFNELAHLQSAAAMYAGGGIYYTSNDAAAATYPMLKDVGTMGHRYVQHFDSEDEAFEIAVNSPIGKVTVLLIDLVDSLEGIEKALALKLKYRNNEKHVWIRLDSGDIAAQAVYALKRYKQMGFLDPEKDKVVAEDLDKVEEMYEIDEAVRAEGIDPEKYLIYGAGSLLVTKNKDRGQASTGFKLSQVEDSPRMKFSNSPEKESLPGVPTLAMLNNERIVTQVRENPEASDIFVPYYRNGKVQILEDLDKVRSWAQESFAQISHKLNERTPLSPETKAMAAKLRTHYNKKY